MGTRQNRAVVLTIPPVSFYQTFTVYVRCTYVGHVMCTVYARVVSRAPNVVVLLLTIKMAYKILHEGDLSADSGLKNPWRFLWLETEVGRDDSKD